MRSVPTRQKKAGFWLVDLLSRCRQQDVVVDY